MPQHRQLGLALCGTVARIRSVPRATSPSPSPVTNSPRKESTRLGPRIGSTRPTKPLRPETSVRAGGVGHVAELARGLGDALARLQRDLLMAGKRPRHRRDRQVEPSCQFLERLRAHTFLPDDAV